MMFYHWWFSLAVSLALDFCRVLPIRSITESKYIIRENPIKYIVWENPLRFSRPERAVWSKPRTNHGLSSWLD